MEKVFFKHFGTYGTNTLLQRGDVPYPICNNACVFWSYWDILKLWDNETVDPQFITDNSSNNGCSINVFLKHKLSQSILVFYISKHSTHITSLTLIS